MTLSHVGLWLHLVEVDDEWSGEEKGDCSGLEEFSGSSLNHVVSLFKTLLYPISNKSQQINSENSSLQTVCP